MVTCVCMCVCIYRPAFLFLCFSPQIRDSGPTKGEKGSGRAPSVRRQLACFYKPSGEEKNPINNRKKIKTVVITNPKNRPEPRRPSRVQTPNSPSTPTKRLRGQAPAPLPPFFSSVFIFICLEEVPGGDGEVGEGAPVLADDGDGDVGHVVGEELLGCDGVILCEREMVSALVYVCKPNQTHTRARDETKRREPPPHTTHKL